ncbi:MAG: ABC transporter permease [Planctomycetaceae bacterium]
MLAQFLRTFLNGFKSLMLHKLRASLAMLGILIGVTAVIWLVALGEGVSYQAQQQIKDLGATNIIIKSVKPANVSSRSMGAFFIEYGITRDDFERVRAIPTVIRSVPMRDIHKEARFQDRTCDVRFIGCTSDYFEINHLSMERGRFITDRDGGADPDNVCVVGSETAKVLFPFEDPLGRTVKIDNDFYVVIGLTASRLPSAAIGGSLEGHDYNTDIYIPLATFRARIGDQVFTAKAGGREGEIIQLNQITVTVAHIDQVEQTADLIKTQLEHFHKTPEYAVIVPKELLRQAEMLQMMFNALLVVISGISLVVGGIGIMNIMLATVTERTREIGIRRALGAKRRDIIAQFLAETVVLTGTGGVLGMACGYLCSPVTEVVRWILREWFSDVWKSLPLYLQALEPMFTAWSFFVAFGISVVVGVAFGVYPASRAAMMDPIEALRHE